MIVQSITIMIPESIDQLHVLPVGLPLGEDVSDPGGGLQSGLLEMLLHVFIVSAFLLPVADEVLVLTGKGLHFPEFLLTMVADLVHVVAVQLVQHL